MKNTNKDILFEIQARHQNVTGSCMLCTIYFPNKEKFKFIVDAGFFQEENLDFLNRYSDFKMDTINHLFITHSHIDHIGAIPFFVKNGFCGNIYASKKAMHVLPISLFDSAKNLLKDSAISRLEPIYYESDVISSLEKITPCEYEETIKINQNVKVTFFENGHLLGASVILFQITFKDKELNVLFTGDYNNKNYFFTPKKLPSWVTNIKNLIIVQEATYGNVNSNEVEKRFDKDLISIVNSKKSVFIPTFALERYEVILAHIKKLQENKELSTAIPIYIDSPLAWQYLKKYTKVYGNYFLPENLIWVTPLNKNEIITSNQQKIIISTSGMCTNGPAPEYLKSFISNPNYALMLTCFLTTNSLGAKILKFYNKMISNNSKCANTEFKIGDEYYDFKISVYHTSEFSSHAKADVLIKFLKQFKNISAILINHGTADAKSCYCSKLKELGFENSFILSREVYFTLDKTGVVAQKNTKFRMVEPVVCSRITSTGTFKKKYKRSDTRRRPLYQYRRKYISTCSYSGKLKSTNIFIS